MPDEIKPLFHAKFLQLSAIANDLNANLERYVALNHALQVEELRRLSWAVRTLPFPSGCRGL